MDCGHEVTLRSGTVMQGSNLPIFDWFVAMFLIVSTKRAISALEVQRQLGEWLIMERQIRKYLMIFN